MKTLEEIAEEFLIRQGCQRMDCDGENCNFFEDVQPKDLIEFAKWQQERMYGEEELKSAFKIGFNIGYGSPLQGLDLKNEHCERWFEQFKKK
jgi:hypothetical protein